MRLLPHLGVQLLAVFAFGLAGLSAQTGILHSEFDNLVFNDGVSTGGPNLSLAIRTQIPTGGTATRVEVWTGERSGTNTIALWSHDAVNNRPLAPLGAASWSMSAINGWQGANFPSGVPLLAGQTVWVVWTCILGSQSSIHGTGAGAQPYRTSVDGGATWGTLYTYYQWKFRIWRGSPGHYERFGGSGCLGSNGVPALDWYGLPMIGSSFDIHLTNGVPGGMAFLTMGQSNTTHMGFPLPYSLAPHGAPGCAVMAAPMAMLLLPAHPVTGAIVYPLATPASPGLIGLPIYNQWLCFDSAANALGVTVSNGGMGRVGG